MTAGNYLVNLSTCNGISDGREGRDEDYSLMMMMIYTYIYANCALF